jgi:uncharacterized phage protein (TIGR01671 family)
MKELKFRAWDKYNKKMHYQPEVNFHFFDDEFTCVLNEHNQVVVQPESVVVMQFTGLKDKNGKEIYEGDIVEYIERLPIFSKKRLSLVQFIGGNVDYANNFLISPFVNIGSFNYETNCITGTLNNPKESIVIGNIYENPELLK